MRNPAAVEYWVAVDYQGDIKFYLELQMFLCYDVKGIQPFIFAVPKLKSMIGASSLIDGFDEYRDTSEPILIYSGGGRGAFQCKDLLAAEALRERLLERAHKAGIDLRIGISDSFSDAALRADRLYPFIPDSLAGEPCGMSGLWPVVSGKGESAKKDVHPKIWQRREEAKQDFLGKRILKELQLDEQKAFSEIDIIEFFKTVSISNDDPTEDAEESLAGQASLGNRNRWAIICLDGNNMGQQFLAAQKADWKEESFLQWLKCMSLKIKECTFQAFVHAMGTVIQAWLTDKGISDSAESRDRYTYKEDGNKHLVLPFRPIILGGDDVTLLCHPSYAIRFVQAMSARFTELSIEAAKKSKEEEQIESLWLATNDKLTISAGILFAKVTFPLHMAIPYAESLLASAKGAFRNHPGKDKKEPMPAAIDWDVVTDTLIDTPAARRNRELHFTDEDLGKEVVLTRRPYSIEELPELLKLKEELAELSNSARAKIMHILMRPWSERVEFVASVAQRHPLVYDLLWEGGRALQRGWSDDKDSNDKCVRSTGVLDALILLEEEHRMQQETS